MPYSLLLTLAGLLLFGGIETAHAAEPNGRERFFEQHVRPVLVKRCFSCHGADMQEGELRLDSREAVLKGNASGPAAVAGKPDESRLMDVVRYDEGDIQMPPTGKLPDDEIAVLRQWIADGLFWPESFQPLTSSKPDASEHWAYQPVVRPEVPSVKNAAWPNTPIDRFILAKLEAVNLKPSAEADRRAWLRRVSFSLTGLPPTAVEVAAFEQDTSPDAYERVVERLLASPRYGERWARHWLDVARYADTKGYVFQEDRNYPEAWTYRDWVVRAFNENMPYDRFVKYQLAADKLTDESNAHEQCAMGFLTLGRRFLNNRHDIIDDRIDVTTRGLMGLTVSCARCHDHKYDPIPTADYYSLYGVFNSSEEPKDGPSPLRLVDTDKPREPVVFLRGQPGNNGPRVPRQFLEVIAGEVREPFTDGSGRLEMAEAIVDPENPLTARVLVNRVWGHHFGSHLVATPSDFGVRADAPTHPELLDWLAAEFVESGWSVKHLHRLIVLSATYRQESRVRGQGSGGVQSPRATTHHSPLTTHSDPENRLLWRMNRQRLDFEAHRDALLAASGRLSQVMGGPSVDITEPPFNGRRSVYAHIDRQNLPGVFRTFDFASPDTHSPKRYETSVPQQALFQLNSPFLLEQAVALAARSEVSGESTADATTARIRRLYRLAYGCEPSAEEIDLGRTYLAATPESTRAASIASTWSYGYGRVEEPDTAAMATTFTPLPHWTGSAWQGGAKLPDPALGWVMLNAKGGHTGTAPDHCAIRRWTAPADGRVTVSGRLRHPSQEGDGVRARVVCSERGRLGEWTAHNSAAETPVAAVPVRAGETLDFVVDCRGNVGWDSFEWSVTVRLDAAEGSGGSETFSSEAQFHGPTPRPLGPWERYAQVLLLTNGFVFVD